MIFTPNPKILILDIYFDVYFARLFVAENKHDQVCVKSWTGLLLNFDIVHIYWSSKLQSEIALLILETEYILISQGIQEMVSVCILILEVSTRRNLDLRGASTVSKAWEDNVGSQNFYISKDLLMTSYTKYICITYQWFRSISKIDKIRIWNIKLICNVWIFLPKV